MPSFDNIQLDRSFFAQNAIFISCGSVPIDSLEIQRGSHSAQLKGVSGNKVHKRRSLFMQTDGLAGFEVHTLPEIRAIFPQPTAAEINNWIVVLL